jgi:hypothetical protein
MTDSPRSPAVAAREPSRSVTASLLARALAAQARVHAVLLRVDPNDDDGADPLSVPSLLALAIALTVSVGMFVRWRIQPMQDLGHHLAMSAIVADYGRPGSLYPDLYEPFDFLAANSLLYTVAGYGGRLVGVTLAVRACMVFYLAGVPLATLYALRVFGRSPWGAVLSVPLVYNMCFCAGFANFLFAGPLVVLAVPLFYRALHESTAGRLLPVATLFILVFLAHAHAYLWLGVLCFGVTLAVASATLTSDGPARERLRLAGTTAMSGLACVAPSLLLFGHWYQRAFGEARAAGGVMAATASAAEGFGAYYRPIRELFYYLPLFAMKTFVSDEDLAILAVLGVLVLLALTVSRSHRYARPPVLEFCCALTFVSYFFLPENLSGHDVLGSRQPSIALWFLPAFVSPVPLSASRLGRAVVIGGILCVVFASLEVWHDNLVRFQTEAAGLEEVLAAAPPRKRLHYVKMEPESEYFTWRSFWHVDKLYMSDKFGTVPDTPGLLSTSAIRYREGIDIHRVTDHADDWPENPEVWDNFDLVLVHDWTPDSDDITEALRRGHPLAVRGPWQLWATNGPASPEPP